MSAERLKILCANESKKCEATFEIIVLPEWSEKRKRMLVESESRERGLLFLEVIKRETVKVRCRISKNQFFNESRKEIIKK